MKKLFILCVVIGFQLLVTEKTKAQQAFAKSFDISSTNIQLPDFKTSGTSMTRNNDGVLIYGTSGFAQHQLLAIDGGHGLADVVVLKNDVNGNNIWAFTLGTTERDVVSRVLEDANGDIVLSGYTRINGQNNTFLAKVTPVNLGSGVYSFTLQWVRTYGEGIITDMIEVRRPNPSVLIPFRPFPNGYALCGINDAKSFVIRTNGGGNTTVSGTWATYYEHTEGVVFNTLLQSTITMQQSGSLPIVSTGTSFYVAGAIGNSAYVAKLSDVGSLITSIDLDEFLPLCPGSQNSPQEIASMVSASDQEFVLFGSDPVGVVDEKLHLTKVSFVTQSIVWNREFFLGAGTVNLPIDLNKTADGYVGLYAHAGSSALRMIKYDANGSVLTHKELSNYDPVNQNTHYSFSRQSSASSSKYPLADFNMQDGHTMHLSGSELMVASAPTGWAQDNVPHLKIKTNNNSCIEAYNPIQSNKFCDEYFALSAPKSVSRTSTLPIMNFSMNQPIGITPIKYDYCSSNCVVDESYQTLFVVQGDLVVLSANPNFDIYNWSNGETGNEIQIVANNDRTITVQMVDISTGCVTYITFRIVVVLPRLKSSSLEAIANEITVYPNPSNGQFNVQLPIKGLKMMVTDISGKVILEKENLPKGSNQFDFSSEDAGVYIIHLNSKEINKRIKFVKY